MTNSTDTVLLTVKAIAEVADGMASHPMLGIDENGQLWGWFEQGALSRPVGSTHAVDRAALLPINPHMSTPMALERLRLLTPWRLVRAGEISLGSSVVVSHALLAREILALSRLVGARWRAVGGIGQSELDAEFFVRFAQTDAVIRGLPERPDTVIVTGANSASIRLGCRICRDNGVVVVQACGAGSFDLDLYPDVHSRGLRVKLLSRNRDTIDSWNSLETLAASRGGNNWSLLGAASGPP